MNKPPHTLLSIGKITGIHGLKGGLKIWSFAESIDTFARGRQLRLTSEDDPDGTEYTLVEASPRNKGVVIRLKDVETLEAAQTLVGKEIMIPREELPELEKDVWYWQDLYGLTVVDQTQERLGIVESIFSTSAHDILVVKNKPSGRDEADAVEILIPMHGHFIESVDLDAGIIRTTLPEDYLS